MGTLFECLREARLEKYYPSFRAHGITKSESLAKLSATDCGTFGINSMEDRRRLIELIGIIKSVHDSESLYATGTPPQTQHTERQAPRKRNRSPTHGMPISSRNLSATNDVQVRERRPLNTNTNSAASPISRSEFLQLLTDSSTEESSSNSSEHSDYEPATKQSNTASATPPQAKKAPVERVKHTSGYNYGVPTGASPTKPKPRPASSRHLGEEKIKVCVRKRPLSKKEAKGSDPDVCRAESTTLLTVKEPKQAVDLKQYTLQHEFMFDEVFDENCTNEDVYIRAARPLINCVFEGGKATCFAYGQTGAGKTYTMIGTRDVPGLYLLAAHDIFTLIESGQYGTGLKVWVSFFEIYCGQLFDLLNKRNRLHAREDGTHKVCIAGLTETEAKDVTSLMQVLEYGNAVRSKGSTGVNADSSRSHAVLQLEVRRSTNRNVGRISFIDLAGSERAADVTDTDRQTRMEGAEINQSLLALKECIRSIDQESKHKPFRQSKLTHILKDSFVGNSRTCMIANISPIQSSCEHTLNTLRYADRVKELRRGILASGTRSSVPSHVLMNIPPSAPSIFQPSNILCSSTPVRPQTTRHTASRDRSPDVLLDPFETPIKGHGVRRKTAAAAPIRSQPPKSSNKSQIKISVTRHVAPHPTTNVQVLASAPSSASSHAVVHHSDSDHTDTDSCNVTESVQNKNNIPSAGSAVVKSTDTDNDFPTTDFNNSEELNDLNRTGGKTSQLQEAVSQAQADLPANTASSTPSLLKGMQTSGFMGGLSVSTNSPVLRQKSYGADTVSMSQPYGATTACSQSTSGITRTLLEPTLSVAQRDSGRPLTAPKVSDRSPQHHAGIHKPATAFTESFEDDLLFEVPNEINNNGKLRVVENVPSGDIYSPSSGVFRGRDPKIPQDPLLNPIIPAVLPAKSSDLTVFSQRSPGRLSVPQNHDRHMDYLSKNNSGVLPIPSFSAATTDRVFESQLEAASRARTPSPRTSEHEASFEVHRGSISDQGQGLYSYKNQERKNGSILRRGGSDPALSIQGGNENQTLLNAQYLNEYKIPVSLNTQVNPISASVNTSAAVNNFPSSHWYSTPADLETHIVRSVNLAKPEDRQNPATESDYKDLMSDMDREQTELKEMYDELPEFLPIQRRPYTGKVPSCASLTLTTKHDSLNRQDSDERIEGNISGHSDIKSVHSDSSLCQASSRSHLDTSGNSGTSAFAGKDHSLSKGYGSDTKLYKSSRLKSVTGHVSKEILGAWGKQDGQSVTDGHSSDEAISKHSNVPNDNFYGERATSANSPYGGKSSNATVKTEKLGAGSVFSPIHPQPVTSNRLTSNGSVALSKDIVQPKPMTTSSSVNVSKQLLKRSESLGDDPRSRMISAHEEQLATVTSLCKSEMKLLLGAKAGNKTFDEYMRRVGDILRQKIGAIQLLQDQLNQYHIGVDEEDTGVR